MTDRVPSRSSPGWPAGPGRAWPRGRASARASTGALANMLLLAFVVLAFVRPGPVQAALWPLACAAAGASAALLIPVALVLGGASVVALGVASMAFSALAWLLLATGLLELGRRGVAAGRVRAGLSRRG